MVADRVARGGRFLPRSTTGLIDRGGGDAGGGGLGADGASSRGFLGFSGLGRRGSGGHQRLLEEDEVDTHTKNQVHLV